MKGFTRRFGVGVVAASLVMSSSMSVFAAGNTPAGTGSATGTGGIEGVVNTDVYTADLPTVPASTYNYIADPQGLIRKTNAAKYSGATFGEGTVFFQNADGSYSNTSDPAKIVNKSSKNLSVTVTAKATPDAAGAALAASSTFAGTDKEVYLGITDSVDGSTEQALTAAGATMTAVLGAAPGNAYEYSYDGTNYQYAIKSDVSGFRFAEYSFQINGSANANATDWASDTALPAIDVTWAVDLTDDTATVETPDQTPSAPSVPATATYSKTSGAEIAVDLGGGNLAATSVTSIQAKNTASGNLYTAANASFANGKITIAAAQWAAAQTGAKRWVVVTFNDAAGTTKTIEVTVAD